MTTENSSSGWLGGFGDTLSKLGTTAGNFLSGWTNAQANQTAADAQKTNAKANLLSAANMKKILPWVIGGVVVLVGLMFLRRK